MKLIDLDDQVQYLVFAEINNSMNHIFDCESLWKGGRLEPILSLCGVSNKTRWLSMIKSFWPYCEACISALEKIP